MKNVVVRYWTINLLLAITTYTAYRLAIANTTAEGEGMSATILHMLDVLVNLGFSLLYLAGMVVCSFAVFLNLIKSIRDSYFLSWLTFSGAPILFVVIFVIFSIADGSLSGVMTKSIVVATLYPCITTFVFFKFRRLILSKNTCKINDKKNYQRSR